MHTTPYLKIEHYSFKVRGMSATINDIFPNFHAQDRIGIVVRQSSGATGVGSLLMAAITRFYDFFRDRDIGNGKDQFRIYPDNFVFHVGEYHFNHRRMDIWPPHKEIVVEDKPELILQAINDRGITRLIVEDRPKQEGRILKETLNGAKERIQTAIAFSPSGRINDENIEVASAKESEKFIQEAIMQSKILTEDLQDQYMKARESLEVNGKFIETYRQLTIDEAIGML